MIAGLELTPFFALVGLAAALLSGWVLLTERIAVPVAPSAGRAQRWSEVLTAPVTVAVAPLALVAVAFAVSGAVNAVWLLVVALVVAGLFVQALATLRAVHKERGDTTISGPVVATAVLLLVLLEFHWLVVVRLAVAQEPDGGLLPGLDGTAFRAGTQAVLLPALGLSLALLVAGRRGVPLRQRAGALFARLPAPVRRSGPALLVFALFIAPAVPGLGGSAGLTFLGIATPEFGKILFFWVLAGIVATHVVTSGGDRRAGVPFLQNKRLLYPSGLFLLVAAASALRKDLGPLIPVFAGTLGMTWAALRDEADRRVAGAGTGKAADRDAVRTARRLFLVDLRIPAITVVIFAIAAAIVTDYVKQRVDVLDNAWAYNWNASCEELPDTVEPVGGRTATDLCLRNLLSADASRQSQVAKAVAAVADGGLWGRGLQDTASRIVPLSESDFVIAAVWNKLGGIVVVLGGIVMAMLAVALSRAVWRQRPAGTATSPLPPAADRSRLFAAGLVASLLGQYVFVLFATLNWVPHSGVTAPLLSRGGQSTLALGLGVVIALALGYGAGHSGRPTPTPTGSGRGPAASGRRPRRPPARGAVVVAAVVVLAAATITLRPYGGYPEDRQLCRYDRAVNDPELCSTDLLAYGRTRIEVGFPDGSRFSQLQSDGRWTRTAGEGPGPEQLGGLLQVPGGERGLVDIGLPDVVGASRGTNLTDRLLPHVADDRPDAEADLTLDPALQIAVADALTRDGPPEAPPLAGGVVVLDAATGHLLAASSAPRSVPAPPGESAPLTDEERRARREFITAQKYRTLTPDGRLVDAAAGECEIRIPARDNNPNCYKLYPTERPDAGSPAQAAEERRYLADLADKQIVRAPSAQVNRAIGELYGPGSTFKVVTAAAYLAMPGTSADDRIEAPASLDVGGEADIRNSGRGECPGTSGGAITLRQALAVSCNTAFVQLARTLGWDRVRDMAVSLGFQVRPGAETPVEGVPALPAVVPAEVGGAAIGNAALGGGEVVSTPLQVAAVMATIANGGRYVRPTMATEVRTPRTGTSTAVPVQESRPLTEAQAEQLRSALRDTTSEKAGGTARTVRAPDGRQLWLKSGTHALYADGEQPAEPWAFRRQIAWMAGFFETDGGPVAIAVAVETNDQDQGAARVRAVANDVIAAAVRTRG